ncbi:hypothetical protein [Cloacibacillus porcorum]|uniref:Uncharacterized protein n=1 Tax=Cloacibacillus porcorum TaxID=1197717 RepID=A0A1B2I2M4_9BACT|nr:hypothetical protein [Cloacibacillus porcorum]ANZ44220.1 hypothetical protein BED41_03415 [Cloacibacillus porcorum]
MGETDICNRALVLAGCSRGITSMGEGSTEAAICRRVYLPALRSLLSEYPWRWATRIVAPAEMEVSVPGWRRLYDLPEDCLVVTRIFNEAEANAPFTVLMAEDLGNYVKAVATDLYQASMEYVSSAASADMPELFAEALAYRIAMEVCVALKGGDINMREHLAKFYNEAVRRAAWNDANECVVTCDEWGDEYLRARS